VVGGINRAAGTIDEQLGYIQRVIPHSGNWLRRVMIKTQLGYKYDEAGNIPHEQIVRVIIWHINGVQEPKTII
jgi:hypothetical protein